MNSIIFDMDGVIIDSFENHCQAFDIVMKKHFGFNVTREEFKGYFGGDPREITRKLLISHGVEREHDIIKLHGEKKEAYSKLTEKGFKLLPGVKELLASLKERKMKVGLASSSSKKELLPAVEKTGLQEYFQVIVGIDDVEKGKPNPDLFLKAAEELKVKPEDCIVIEDSLHGVQAGKAAGMRVIGVQTGFRTREELEKAGADVVVENLEKLTLGDLKT